MRATEQLTYRLYDKKDIPGIISLWENHSDWGAITEKQFNEWYIDTPVGKSLIVVAQNEMEEIIGQLSFIPAVINLDSKEIKALRLSAPIIHKDFRSSELKSKYHPAFQMIKFGIVSAEQMDYSLLYGLPAHGWLGLLKMFPLFGFPDIKTDSFDCVAISLKDEKVWERIRQYDENINVIKSFDSSYDELWEDAVSYFPIQCGIVRHSDRLTWKISHHLVFEIRGNGKLIGYSAFKKKEGLLTDILARNPGDLKIVLFNSLKAIHAMNESKIPVSFDEIKLMLSRPVKQILDSINHQPVNYQFGFGCYPLQDTINQKSILPGNWYIMPDD